jgi:hypothetical protein
MNGILFVCEKCLFFFALMCAILSKMLDRRNTMTHSVRAAAYRYFSFTYYFGKAYFGLAESARA